MAVRSINAPGIEIRELDQSSYENKPDYSIVGTTTLVCGFADKGENYTINWINTQQTYADTYGYPTNEYEKYFYNAATEILNNGGVLLAAKLPYDNISKDRYAYCEYEISNATANIVGSPFEAALSADSTISNYLQITEGNKGTMSIEEYDSYKIHTSVGGNKIRIVDITHTQYDKLNILRRDGDKYLVDEDVECLGVMPIIVTPMNALYYQKLIPISTSIEADPRYNATRAFLNEDSGTTVYSENDVMIERSSDISNFTVVGDFKCVEDVTPKNFIDENFATLLSSESINDYTVSKQAANCFPLINNVGEYALDRTYYKQIGVVVFKVYKDEAADNKINFALVEAFVGSLDRNDKDQITKKSIFIDDIVNTNSKYINLFSGCNTNSTSYKTANIYALQNQVAANLGFYKYQCEKNITYQESILKPLTIIFDNAKDQNRYQVDLVLDAGVSNLAQMAYQQLKSLEDLFLSTVDPDKTTKAWKAVLQKYDNFAKNMRKDCMFLADGHRGFCLEQKDKYVRPSVPTNTVENSILPKMKYMVALNSSYSAGYCNWFRVLDRYTSDPIWLPPSIKAASIYLYTDTYYNQWDAPAGLNRGVLKDVIDCAFSPSQEDAGKIYNQSWNYAINYPLNGIAIEGQKTFQSKKTAFDRVNVRRLFLYLERRVSRIAKYFVYEGNTPYLRQRFVDSIRPLFEDAKEKNGILEYYIRCDDTNNNAQTIENNELHCSIAVKPVKTIEFIVLNFVCTNQTANVVEAIANV